jgi:hypothetical protein
VFTIIEEHNCTGTRVYLLKGLLPGGFGASIIAHYLNPGAVGSRRACYKITTIKTLTKITLSTTSALGLSEDEVPVNIFF